MPAHAILIVMAASSWPFPSVFIASLVVGRDRSHCFQEGGFTPQESFEGPSRGSCELGDDFWYGTPSREGCQLNPKERHLVVARPHC